MIRFACLVIVVLSSGASAQPLPDTVWEWWQAREERAAAYTFEPCEPDRVYGAADAVWLARSGQEFPLATSQLFPSGDAGPSLVARQSDLGMVPGIRAMVGMRCGDRYGVDGSYLGLREWSNVSALVGDPNNLSILFFSPYLPLSNQFGFDTFIANQYSSELHNADLNLSKFVVENRSWSWALFGGVRYLQLREQFGLAGSDTFSGAEQQIFTAANNYLIGPQLGSRAGVWLGPVYFGVALKGALAANWHDQQLTSSGNDPLGQGPLPIVQASTSATNVAGILDLGVTASLQVTQHLAIRAGYQLLYVAGLALAPQQLSSFNSAQDLLLQGPTVGGRISWGGSRAAY